ncbi:GFA family protein [Litorimonas sp. RW-G-Af-16]|uniref:GFA family protein n=1 Tax=Litorimonas sp. RW-G-Af-16 TaxID=3241168 RepID=UPI00390CC8B5
MPKLTGHCLCGQVSFEADGDIVMQGNCHCTDCQQVSGSAFATLVFVKEDAVTITGETKRFEHGVDSGNKLTKDFCTTCGSQMFGGNVGRPGMVALKAGSINEKEHIKPQFNVYASRKLDCVILDDTIPAFDKMPG